MDVSRATNALKGTVRSVEADIADILQSGNYYCTEEIARELTAIKNGLDHLKLDGTLLGSNEWSGSFDPRSTAEALAGMWFGSLMFYVSLFVCQSFSVFELSI